MDALEDFEIALLLSAMEHRWGYDFRGYSRASIKRRIRHAMIRHRIKLISALVPRVLHEPEFFQDVVRDFSITVTEMFRDPHVWRTLQTEVFPRLATWPYFKVWHAACATGEEVYSMAILLKEAKLLDRATIYATDFNDSALASGRNGVYASKDMQSASRNYLKAGGSQSLSAHYSPSQDGEAVQMDKDLRNRIVWANHNLVTDHTFGEMNLIVCRNVLIYFTQPLQNRTLELFTSSLPHGGFLCLGNKETLDFSSVSGQYKAIVAKDKLYRRVESDVTLLNERASLGAPRPVQSRATVTWKSDAVSAPLRGVIAIGCSLGGMDALFTLLAQLIRSTSELAGITYSILITQHVAMSPESAMAEVLQRHCLLPVKEAEEGETILPGTVYLAPADYHLLLNEDWTLALCCDERDNYSRPSINVMFESVAEVCGSRAIGVLMTGANEDGARGLAAIQTVGGFTIVQDPKDAVAAVMPEAGIKLIRPDRILPIAAIASAIQAQLQKSAGAADRP